MPVTPTPPDCPPCVPEPGIPPRVGSAASVSYAPDLSWDSGANSVTRLAGDVILTFTARELVGCIAGLRLQRELITSFSTYFAAFLIQNTVSQNVYSVLENGLLKTLPVVRTFTTVDENANPCDEFSIARQGSALIYRVNSVVVYSSTTTSVGPCVTSATLYCPGDTIG